MSQDVAVQQSAQENIRKQRENIEYCREVLNKRRRKILKKLEERVESLNKQQRELQIKCGMHGHSRLTINQRFRTGHCPDCGHTFLEHELSIACLIQSG